MSPNFPACVVNTFGLCFALDVLSQVNAIVSAVQNESATWWNVYDKMNALRAQTAALNDKLAAVCMHR